MNTFADEVAVKTLYQAWLDAWNQRDAALMASLLTPSGQVIGFDGSQMAADEVEPTMDKIFKDHKTAAYIGIVRGVDQLSDHVAVLRAVAGMVPHGKKDIDPDVNTVQSIVALKQEGRWHIALIQNTPLHGQAAVSKKLSEDLRKAYKASQE